MLFSDHRVMTLWFFAVKNRGEWTMEFNKELEAVELTKDKVVTVSPSMNLDDALKILIDAKYSAVPVVNENGLYVGVVSKTAILGLVSHGRTVHYHHLKERYVFDALNNGIPSLPINSSFKDLMGLIMCASVRFACR